jgi:hypothetical protein
MGDLEMWMGCVAEIALGVGTHGVNQSEELIWRVMGYYSRKAQT